MDRSLLRQASVRKLMSLGNAYQGKFKLRGPNEPCDLDLFWVES